MPLFGTLGPNIKFFKDFHVKYNCMLENIKNSLEFLGLSDRESSIYLFICTHPKTTAGKMIKELGIARSKTYDGLNKLIEMELIEKSESGVATYWSAGAPVLEKTYKKRVSEVGRSINYLLRGMGGISTV